ncbi:MAG: DNA polymerase III subunit alpha [Bacilli bacterium]
MGFVHLQVRSAYSLLQSSLSVESIARLAKECNMKSVALTDVRALYGAYLFQQVCDVNDITPIFGLTVQTGDEGTTSEWVILAKNDDGYARLVQLSSHLLKNELTNIPVQELIAYTKNCVVISTTNHEIITLMLTNEDDQLTAYKQRVLSQFEDFYIGLTMTDEVREERKTLHITRKCESFGLAYVALGDVCYGGKEDADVQRVLACIESGKRLDESGAPPLLLERHFASQEEMEQRFARFPQALANSIVISEKCNVRIPSGIRRIPKYPIHTNERSIDLLTEKCLEGLAARGKRNEKIYIERLNYELETIQSMDFVDYFLIVWDFMDYAHRQGIIVGPGRGSAAGSLVSYVLGITDVDPIAYGLLFERFLNPERISMPDIDIDFPDVRRDEMIRYVLERYGTDRVAQIVTFGTFGAKQAIRDACRVFGLSAKESDAFSKLIPNTLHIALADAKEQSRGLQNHLEVRRVHKQIFDLACKIEGLPRHTSIHAAGVIISDQPLVDYVPVTHGEVAMLTQWTGESLEKFGLLKMDFLALRNLTLIEQVTTNIQKELGTNFSWIDIPMNDAPTLAMIAKAETTGVFQFESDGMRNVLTRLKPTDFEDLVAVNALFRPGPMEEIQTYIDRKYGRKRVVYLHSDLEPILKPTYGVIVYQEQIMQIAAVFAGYRLGEADLLRRAVSKKELETLQNERAKFVRRSVEKGYPETTANALYDLIVKFANYGFNRSHAVCYSLIAYRLAYLKTHYPFQFYTALLNSVMGNELKLRDTIREARRNGVVIREPDISYSAYRFYVHDNTLVFPLLAVKQVGVKTVERIVRERNIRPFQDFIDFVVRMGEEANRKVVESLILAGAFGRFGVERNCLLASVQRVMEYATLVRPDNPDQLAFDLTTQYVPKPTYVRVSPMGKAQMLAYEREVFGFYLTAHPLDLYAPKVQVDQLTELSDASKRKGSVTVAVWIRSLRTIRTKKLESMCSMVIEDQSKEMDAIVFPQAFRSLGAQLKEETAVALVGTVRENNGREQFVVDALRTLQPIEETTSRLFLSIASQGDNGKKQAVAKVLKQFRGHVPVILYFADTKTYQDVSELFRIKPTEECLGVLRRLLGENAVVLKT